MKSKKEKESQDTITISAGNSNVANFQNATGSPIFGNPDISGAVTYNNETASSPTIESPLKFERNGNYYSLEEPIVFGGQTETREYKFVSNTNCKCGGKCKKKEDQCDHDHHKSGEKNKGHRKGGFFSKLLSFIFRKK
jgi:hypothetical protein